MSHPTVPCATADELHAFIVRHTGLRVPRVPLCANHQAPFDYVRRAYFEPSADQIVWAPRGGGKTTLAAVVTLLDLLHKPGVSVRILGGSLEQSLRMWDALLPHLETIDEGLIENPKSTARKLRLTNGSTAAVLTQSQRSVRGLRVQKIRCDEVELFDPLVWEAAQLATRSRTRTADEGGGETRGTIEALSTLHRPFGLMQSIVDDAAAAGRSLVRWCLFDVIERCPPERDCAACPLWDDCRGVAKEKADGFFRIDDAIDREQSSDPHLRLRTHDPHQRRAGRTQADAGAPADQALQGPPAGRRRAAGTPPGSPAGRLPQEPREAHGQAAQATRKEERQVKGCTMMKRFQPEVIYDDLIGAINDDQATSFLNRRTGEVARLYPDDQWKEDDVAKDARQDMESRSVDWLPIPVGQENWTDMCHLLVKNDCSPEFV